LICEKISLQQFEGERWYVRATPRGEEREHYFQAIWSKAWGYYCHWTFTSTSI